MKWRFVGELSDAYFADVLGLCRNFFLYHA
jgi:hypothetical protein